MPDKIEQIGRSIIQHGPENDRIYLMKAAKSDGAVLPQALLKIAKQMGYSKIFAKIPENLTDSFESAGSREEATIPGYFNGKASCHMVSFFLNPERALETRESVVRDVLHTALNIPVLKGEPDPLPANHTLRLMTHDDTPQMATVYRQVFASYPFPIHDPAYLKDTMDSHIRYFGVLEDEELIALASCEMDLESAAVEMTDFATLPACRGKGLAVKILYHMEADMRIQGMNTTYTIARALSHGMNITFAKLGYTYSGTLVNNTQISGAMESMNVWHKPLLKL